MGKHLARIAFCFGILVGGVALAGMQLPDAQALEPAAVKTQSTVKASGTVNASELTLGATDTLQLKDGTVLNLDADLSCAAIESSGYDLTIKGSKTLTVYSESTSSIGIYMKLGGDYPDYTTPSLAIESGTVNITASTGIQCAGDVTISGGTVNIVRALRGGIAIQAQHGLDIDNASVYCEGDVEVMESTGSGMTIGSGARITVIQDEGYAYALYVNRSKKTSADTARLTVNGSITKPAGATIGDYETSFNVAAGNETYCETVYDGDSVALEVQVNGGASAEAASDPTYTVGALSATSFTYNGVKQVPSVTVKDGSTTLTAGTHYTLSFAKGGASVTSPVDAGTYAVYVTGKGDYAAMGTVSAGAFTINPKQVSPTFALAATAYTWNGSAKTPGVTVKAGSKTLVENADYTLAYASGRKNVGAYSVNVACKGNYKFTAKTLTFKVNPKGAVAKAPKAAKKVIIVKWTAQKAKMSSARITGYQVQVATNKSFTKGKKQAKVKGYKKASVKVKKLKAKKKYYARVRTYMEVDSVTYYSPWSTYAKAVKAK